MSASKRTASAPHTADGFATLTADMMERGGATPPPLVEPAPDVAPSIAREQATEPAQPFGKRIKPKQGPKRTRNAAAIVSRSGQGAQTPAGAHPCQTTEGADQKVYRGPERRKRDVSPLVERRRSVPPRVKVSVRLEQHRHQRLRGAAVLLARTHQDIITVALDRYLNELGMPNSSDA